MEDGGAGPYNVPDADYRREAAFYIALMGWKLRSDDGKQAVLDIGDWGSAIFKQAREQYSAMVENFCFVIEPWNARTVQAELQKRGLSPLSENDGKAFESFHVKDPGAERIRSSAGGRLTCRSEQSRQVLTPARDRRCETRRATSKPWPPVVA